jgi:hypothetical protein
MRFDWEPATTFGRTGVVEAQPVDYSQFYVSLTGRYANPAWITQIDWNKITNVPPLEPALGNPLTDGYILSSTAAGVRSWIAPPAISGGGTGIIGEDLTAQIDGSTTIFTTLNPFTAIAVYLNGLRQRIGGDFAITSSTQFTFVTAPITGDSLLADYS